MKIATSSDMKKPKQLNLFKADLRFFGGALLKGKRKALRPLSSKDPIHVVLKSQFASEKTSFLKHHNKRPIESIVRTMAIRFHIKVYSIAIQSNHIHIIIKIPHRIQYKAFIKAASSKIALHVMQAKSFKEFLERGDGPKFSKTFWEFRPFTRVLHWGKDLKRCMNYLKQNILEAVGFIEYKPRTNYYSRWLYETIPLTGSP
jgi:REP element-mobilizing transposase RayT